ncbi:MAG: AraC family transcriptional regulator [Betaproteobacteria bacterium]
MGRESTRYWNAAAWPGVSCLEAAFTCQHFAPHSHDAVVIALTCAGGSSYTSRGQSAEATTDALLVFNPSEPHAGHMRHSRYWHYRALYLARPALDALLPALGMARVPGFTRNAIADRELIRAFARAHRELDGGDSTLAGERLVDACGRLFSTQAGEVHRVSDAQSDRSHVDAALATIRQRFRDRLTVSDLARTAGLSPFQLIRQFNRVTGMPPHAHVLRARLHEAIRHLRRGAGLGDASAASGFYDQSALTRQFRRAYGITPGQYLRALRGSA